MPPRLAQVLGKQEILKPTAREENQDSKNERRHAMSLNYCQLYATRRTRGQYYLYSGKTSRQHPAIRLVWRG